MFQRAEAWELITPGRNPCRSVRRYKQHSRERFLTPEEYRHLGRALSESEADGTVWPPAIAAIRLLMLTGCRHSEILTLRWDDVDRTAGELRLPDTKTGARVVTLSPSAVEILIRIQQESVSPWVIPGRKPGTHLGDLKDAWNVVRKRAGLGDVRIHDLRHSHANRRCG